MKTLTFSSACARDYMQQGAKSFLWKRFYFQKFFLKKIRKFGIKLRPATYSIVKKENDGATPQRSECIWKWSMKMFTLHGVRILHGVYLSGSRANGTTTTWTLTRSRLSGATCGNASPPAPRVGAFFWGGNVSAYKWKRGFKWKFSFETFFIWKVFICKILQMRAFTNWAKFFQNESVFTVYFWIYARIV